MDFVVIGILGFLVIAGVILIVDAIRLGIGPVPTSRRVKKQLMRMLPETIDGPVFELGSGWGDLALAVAKRYPGTIVYAIESGWIPWLGTKIRLNFTFPRNIVLIKEDFFTTDLRDAKLVICYLFPGAMDRLKQKFEEELPKGCVVVTHTFSVPGWTPEQTYSCTDLYKTPIYLYKK